jgi:hypothetical protein
VCVGGVSESKKEREKEMGICQLVGFDEGGEKAEESFIAERLPIENQFPHSCVNETACAK